MNEIDTSRDVLTSDVDQLISSQALLSNEASNLLATLSSSSTSQSSTYTLPTGSETSVNSGAQRFSLCEFEPLNNLLNTVPLDIKKNSFSSVLGTSSPDSLTSIDVSTEYIVLGSAAGILYVYDRVKEQLVHRLQPMNKARNEVITRVKLVHSVDTVIAMGTTSGRICIFELLKKSPYATADHKKIQVYIVEEKHRSAITCLEWSSNAMKLFSGDEQGNVVCTLLNYITRTSKSLNVLQEPTAIVQLSYVYRTLLISTLSRSFVCSNIGNLDDVGNNDSEGACVLTQIGQAARKKPGPLGATFLPGAVSARDAVIVACRPGQRLWKADVNGAVHVTYVLKDNVSDVFQNIFTLDADTVTCNNQLASEPQFGIVINYVPAVSIGSSSSLGYVITYQGSSLYVIDPSDGKVMAYHHNLGGVILEVGVSENEVFILRCPAAGQRAIIKLATAPPLRNARGPLRINGQMDVTETLSPVVQTLGEAATMVSSGVKSGLAGVRTGIVGVKDSMGGVKDSLVGVLKDVGGKLQTVQSNLTAPSSHKSTPPWGGRDSGGLRGRGVDKRRESHDSAMKPLFPSENGFAARFNKGQDLKPIFNDSLRSDVVSEYALRRRQSLPWISCNIEKDAAESFEVQHNDEEQVEGNRERSCSAEGAKKGGSFIPQALSRMPESLVRLVPELISGGSVPRSQSVAEFISTSRRLSKLESPDENQSSVFASQQENVLGCTSEQQMLTLQVLPGTSNFGSARNSERVPANLDFADGRSRAFIFAEDCSAQTGSSADDIVFASKSAPRKKEKKKPTSKTVKSFDTVSLKSVDSADSTASASLSFDSSTTGNFSSSTITTDDPSSPPKQTLSNGETSTPVAPFNDSNQTECGTTDVHRDTANECSSSSAEVTPIPNEAVFDSFTAKYSNVDHEFTVKNLQDDGANLSNLQHDDSLLIISARNCDSTVDEVANIQLEDAQTTKDICAPDIIPPNDKEGVNDQKLQNIAHSAVKTILKDIWTVSDNDTHDHEPKYENPGRIDLSLNDNLYCGSGLLKNNCSDSKSFHESIEELSPEIGDTGRMMEKIDSVQSIPEAERNGTEAPLAGNGNDSKCETETNVFGIDLRVLRSESPIREFILPTTESRPSENVADVLINNDVYANITFVRGHSENINLESVEDNWIPPIIQSELKLDNELYPNHESPEGVLAYASINNSGAPASSISDDFMSIYSSRDGAYSDIESSFKIYEATDAMSSSSSRKMHGAMKSLVGKSENCSQDLMAEELKSEECVFNQGEMDNFSNDRSEWLELSTVESVTVLSVSATHVWCTNSHGRLYQSCITSQAVFDWAPVHGKVQQISVSPTGGVVWKLDGCMAYAAVNVTPTRPTGSHWREVADDVMYICVDESVAWYVRVDGSVEIQTLGQLQSRVFRVPCDAKILQVKVHAGVVWALDVNRCILVRMGITDETKEGMQWARLHPKTNILDRYVGSFDLGEYNTAWVLDIFGRLWYMCGVTASEPSGDGVWWQISLTEQLMREPSVSEALKCPLVKSYSRFSHLEPSYRGGVLSTRANGIWLCLHEECLLHVNTGGNLYGYRWQPVTQMGKLSQVKWDLISAVNSTSRSLVWLSHKNGRLQYFQPPATHSNMNNINNSNCVQNLEGRSRNKTHKVSSRIPADTVEDQQLVVPDAKLDVFMYDVDVPEEGLPVDALSAGPDVIWCIVGERAYIRKQMSAFCLAGFGWDLVDLTQLGSGRLVDVSVGTNCVWVVHDSGRAYLRIGIYPPHPNSLCPAWLPVDQPCVHSRLRGREMSQVNSSCVSHSEESAQLQVIQTSSDDLMVWAIDTEGLIYARAGIRPAMPVGTHWVFVEGYYGKSLSIGSGIVCITTRDGELVCRHGVTFEQPDGLTWTKLPGVFHSISVTDSRTVWGVTSDGQLFRLLRNRLYRRSSSILLNASDETANTVLIKGYLSAATDSPDDWQIL